jgi:hypothetical protein
VICEGGWQLIAAPRQTAGREPPPAIDHALPESDWSEGRLWLK